MSATLNSRIGSIGSRVRSSNAMNAISATMPPASEPITSKLPQPASLARISPHTIPNVDAVTSARPITSSRARGP